MILNRISILNFKNIREANLSFSDKFNCFVGLNGQGKTNVLDAIYHLSFTKSAFTPLDNLAITHGENMAMVQGLYTDEGRDEAIKVSCALRRGMKKQFRLGSTDYKRLIDHIGLIPLVLISPEDSLLIQDGSDARRRFMDSVIAQYDKTYLDYLTQYNALLKQRNALLKQLADQDTTDTSMLDVYDDRMVPAAQYIHQARKRFIEAFVPTFRTVYSTIAGDAETVDLTYLTQLDQRDLREAFVNTRSRDLILGWTSQGIHKDDLIMYLIPSADSSEDTAYPIKQIGSQGQQKTYCLAMKLAQAIYLTEHADSSDQSKPVKCLLLLDDIFDKLDRERVERIVQLVRSDQFGQIFITDTDRQHLTDLIQDVEDARIFHVDNGMIV